MLDTRPSSYSRRFGDMVPQWGFERISGFQNRPFCPISFRNYQRILGSLVVVALVWAGGTGLELFVCADKKITLYPLAHDKRLPYTMDS